MLARSTFIRMSSWRKEEKSRNIMPWIGSGSRTHREGSDETVGGSPAPSTNSEAEVQRAPFWAKSEIGPSQAKSVASRSSRPKRARQRATGSEASGGGRVARASPRASVAVAGRSARGNRA